MSSSVPLPIPSITFSRLKHVEGEYAVSDDGTTNGRVKSAAEVRLLVLYSITYMEGSSISALIVNSL